MSDKPVTLAAVIGAHGVAGEVRLKLLGEGQDTLKGLGALFGAKGPGGGMGAAMPGLGGSGGGMPPGLPGLPGSKK